VRVALAGDTMLGRGVADALRRQPPESLVDPELVEITRGADLFVLNLECCISEQCEPAPKMFTFQAPPAAVETLLHLGVDCVTLANNHALDCGTEALLETFDHLRAAGIVWAGAGEDVEQARSPAVVDGLPVLAFADQQASFAAAAGRPGIAYVDLAADIPGWLRERARNALVCPHWGPNMTPSPLPYVRSAARALREAGATLVAGTSAHVFQGVEGNVVYDLGDFLDDYVVDPQLRNDLGLLFLVELEASRVQRIEAVPLKLDYTYTRLAQGSEAEWIRHRFRRACSDLGTEVLDEGGRLVVRPTQSTGGTYGLAG
jgi:poly-gamma-glutamate capsule biosynthesis protein CapA/YwtB (metallophosphatase superfamily)